MWVSDNEVYLKRSVVGEWVDKDILYPYLDEDSECWKHAKPINPNQEKINEINRQIAELTKQKEELCKIQ